MEANGELARVDWDRYFFWAGAYVPEGMSRDQLRRYHRKAFLGFYFRLRIILANSKFLKRPRVLYYALRYLWKRIRPENPFQIAKRFAPADRALSGSST
jgi:hypothetical protein